MNYHHNNFNKRMSQPISCPTLLTQRLRLVPLGEQDAAGLWELWTTPGFAEVAGIELPQDEVVILSNIAYFATLNQSGFYFKWALRDIKTDAFLGEFELYPIKPQIRPWLEWGIGFSLTPIRWRQGLMKEAISSVLQLAFVELGAIRVKADVLLHNERSCGLLQSLGFVCEGTQAQKAYLCAQFEDMYLFAMTRSQYFNLT
jgi:[ribosomal protein S5]-alanine N-acetyltransferase